MAKFTDEEITRFLLLHPHFIVSKEGDDTRLSGTVSIEADGNMYEFEVKICSVAKYPFRFPDVFELSSKIPKVFDWHIYQDGSFCFTIPPLEAIACKDGINLVMFYNDWLIPYLANQQYRMIEGKYVNGEFCHNFSAIHGYYVNLLKTSNPLSITRHLINAIKLKKIERTSFCYCGSGNKYRNCHKKAVQDLWTIGDDMLTMHLNIYLEIINSK